MNASPKKPPMAEKNGKGALALGVVLTLLLGAANLIGGWVVTSVREQAEEINALTLQVTLLRNQVEAIARNQWTVAQQVQFNGELAALNQTLRTPDVRRISREVQ